MQYKVIKDANRIVRNCPYVVNDPYKNKKRWSEVFGNNHPICLELGMGRGDFIIDMAMNYPNINFIGLEVVDSQMVNAVNKLEGKKLNNLKLINADAKEIDNIFGKEIDTIYLTFCDPWPKKGDEKKALLGNGTWGKVDAIFTYSTKNEYDTAVANDEIPDGATVIKAYDD